MKLILCDGRELTVYDVSAPLYRVKARASGVPIKYDGPRMVEDDTARKLLQDLRSSGLYDAERLAGLKGEGGFRK